jgi:hypothetical protein
VPISIRRADSAEPASAHLMDLSYGGAGILTAALEAPAVGEYVDLEFETPTNDGGTESPTRRETGRVVNSRRQDHEIRRLGIRFLQRPDIGCGMFEPNDLLSDHRKMMHEKTCCSRWETARNFRRGMPVQMAAT